ncbi:HAD family hydrolase [Pontibacterium granulatum]|uniref:HAD family hydrolase n=1 Tax=Pontibacterium granulatum TaxID=2036029 RepID=UPI00249BACAC|nr:HAD family hydrolase [Pontibacterium granulatum]MDI3324268.1 HAD family hydrolase [Pontibacterium granulatum]
MALAIFDLDETLVAGDSASLFCSYLQDRGLVDEDYIRRDALMMELYNNEQLSMNEYVEFLVEPVLGLHSDEIDALLPDYVSSYVCPRIYPQGRVLLQALKAQGHRPLIISATVTFIVKAVAHELGVEDVLAIDLVKNYDGYYTGAIDGIPSFREGKVQRLAIWCEEQNENLTDALFHSDSINDLALLEQVPNPVATNPDTKLSEIASQRGWNTLNWQLTETEAPTLTL